MLKTFSKVLAVRCLSATLAGLIAVGGAHADTLDSALASAYRYNPEIEAERARLRATDENVAIAMSGYRPTINSSASVAVQGRNTDPGSLSDGVSKPRTFSITLSQPLFTGFVTTNAVSQAEANVRAGQQALRSVEQSVLQRAAVAYVDVIRDLAIVRLQQSNLEFLGRELQATQDRFSVGEVTRTDVAQARARRSAAVSALSAAQASLKTSQATYRQIVGLEPTNLRDPVLPNKKLPNSLHQALAIASGQNPLIVQALYNEQAARFNVDQLIGTLLPSAALEAQYSVTKDPSPVTERSENASLTGRLSIPIYQGGETRARIRQAKETHVSLLQVVEQQRVAVRQNVVAAWTAYRASRDQLNSDQAQVEANRIALEGVREEERVGQRTLLDVLDAQQELLNAQVSLTTTRRNLVVNAYALLAAIGGLDGASYGVADVVYDPDQHYHKVRAQWFHISITDQHGRKTEHNVAKGKEWFHDNWNRAMEQKGAVIERLAEHKHELAEKIHGTFASKGWHAETSHAPLK